jgi:hypothetical protein
LLDQELQNFAISIKEAIGAGQGVVGNGWQATWKQNKASVKTDWEAVAKALRTHAPSVYERTEAMFTSEKPGARVFRFKKEADGE